MTKLKNFPRQPLKRQAAESAKIRQLENDPKVTLINNKREMNSIYEKAGKKQIRRNWEDDEDETEISKEMMTKIMAENRMIKANRK